MYQSVSLETPYTLKLSLSNTELKVITKSIIRFNIKEGVNFFKAIFSVLVCFGTDIQ